MELNSLIAECTAFDFKLMLEEKKPKSWLKSVMIKTVNAYIIISAQGFLSLTKINLC